VPQSYPRFTAAELAALRGLDYRALAFAVLSRFIDDIPAPDLRRLIDATYTAATFGSDEVTPLLPLEPGLALLRVSNGPTLAFKDIALQLLGRLFEYALAAEQRTLNILGATSGDTGSSAEHAMLGRAGVAVFMLSPRGRMSPFQQAQMYSIDDPSIHNLAIDGSFDDCQDIVKAVSGDAAFKARYRIGAVNSINWAASPRRSSTTSRATSPRRRTMASRCSSRCRRATSATSWPRTSRARWACRSRASCSRPTRTTCSTSSFAPAATVPQQRGDPRDVVALDGHLQGIELRALRVRRRRARSRGSLGAVGPARPRRGVRSLGYAILAEGAAGGIRLRPQHARRPGRDDPRRARALWRRRRPAHRDGLKVGRELRLPGVPLVCVETALPAKFSATIREALGVEPTRPAAYVGLEERPQRFKALPADAERVKAFIAAHAPPV